MKSFFALSPRNAGIWYACFLLISLLVFWPAFSSHKQLLNWDDQLYVTQYEPIKAISWENIKAIFSWNKGVVAWNYHPITMLSLLLNFAISGYDTWSYMLFQLLLHAGSGLLLMRILLRFFPKDGIWCGLAVLFFLIHPLRVESIAWVSERKDALSVFFMLLGFEYYIAHRERIGQGAWKPLAVLWLVFVLALLSKPLAIVLPLLWMCADYGLDGKFSFPLMLKKWPFLLIAAGFAVLTIFAQAEAINDPLKNAPQQIPGFTPFLVPFFGLGFYVLKSFFPAHLSGMYPYPSFHPDGHYYFYATAVGGALFFGFILYWAWKQKRHLLLMAVLFSLVSLVLMLQLVHVGAAIAADRYTYLFHAGFAMAIVDVGRRWKGEFFPWLLGLCLLFLSFVTFFRTKIWENNLVFWKDVNEQVLHYNYEINLLYQAQVGVAMIMKDMTPDRALEAKGMVLPYYQLLMEKDSTNKVKRDLLYALSRVYTTLKITDSSVVFLDRFYALDTSITELNENRKVAHLMLELEKGAALGQQGKIQEAILVFEQAKHWVKDMALYRNLGLAYKVAGNYDLAYGQLDTLLASGTANAVDSALFLEMKARLVKVP